MDKQALIRDMKQTFDGAGLLTPTQILVEFEVYRYAALYKGAIEHSFSELFAVFG